MSENHFIRATDNNEPRCQFVVHDTWKDMQADKEARAEPLLARFSQTLYQFSVTSRRFVHLATPEHGIKVVDARALDDAHDAERVYSPLMFGEARPEYFALRVRSSNALIRRLCGDNIAHWAVVRQFVELDVLPHKENNAIGGVALLLRHSHAHPRDGLEARKLERRMRKQATRTFASFDRGVTPVVSPFGAAVRAYERLTTPHAALLLLHCGAMDIRGVMYYVMRTGSIHDDVEIDDLTPAPFKNWRCIGTVDQCVRTAAYGDASLSCVVGPVETRDEVRRLLSVYVSDIRAKVKRDNRHRRHLHVVNYDSPLEREFVVRELAESIMTNQILDAEIASSFNHSVVSRKF
jgi:hypothetical protein